MLIESETGTVVGRRWSRRAPAAGIGRVALSLERLKARHLGDAEADELRVTAAIGGVRAREAIGGRRAGTIESEHRLARGRRAARAAAARSAAATPARAAARAASSRFSACAATASRSSHARYPTRSTGCAATTPSADRACGGRTHPRSGRDAVADVATISCRTRTADGITRAASVPAAASSRAAGEAATAAGAAPTGADCSARSAARASSLSRSIGRGVATRAVHAAAAPGHRDNEHRESRQPARAHKTHHAIAHSAPLRRGHADDPPHEVAHGHPPCGHVLQETVIPVCTDPSTEQTPLQDCRQLQEIGDVPQLLVPHVTSTAPPALMKQS